MTQLNLYGDARNVTIGGHGVDIAAQRADDLDTAALEFLIKVGGHARALDAASASGGQAARMAVAGADVVALDIDDYTDACNAVAAAHGVEEQVRFVQHDLTHLDEAAAAALGEFDAIVCQRMIHYVPYSHAIDIVRRLKRLLRKGGRLYLSASGLHSELGDGYAAATAPVDMRYSPLSDEMVERHGINGPVCLYSVANLAQLIEAAGMRVERVYASAFGNIKAIAW
jgi:SAM-dependent methyltransferase